MDYLIAQPTTKHADSQGCEAAPETALAVSADELFKGAQELVIKFRGERYRLRKTRNGKLILTK